MRSDLGLATISQRITALSTIGTRVVPAGQAPAGTAFASTLDAALAQQAPPVTGPPGAPATDGGRPPELGAGVRFSGQPSLIVPRTPADPTAAPTTFSAAQGTVDGVGHVDDGHVHAAPALDRSGPPAALQAHGNGRIPREALAPLGIGDHALWQPAAHAFTDLLAAARRDGVDIGINDSYRSYDEQVAMVERYGLYSQGGRAASPGSSNHGWGVALDLDLDSEAQAWMREHGRDYGFVEDVPREPWHWTFRASSY